MDHERLLTGAAGAADAAEDSAPRRPPGPSAAPRARGLGILHDLLRRINADLELAATLQAVVEGVVDGLGFEVAAINLVRPDRDLEVAAVAGSDEARAAIIGQVAPRAGWDRLLASGTPAGRGGGLRLIDGRKLWDGSGQPGVPEWVWVPPEEGDPGDEQAWHPWDGLVAPLFSTETGLIGVLAVDLPLSGRRPGPEDLELLEMFAAQAALSVENARLHATVLAREADKSELLGRLIAAHEDTQARLALDLHDGPVQSLAAVSIQLEHAAALLSRGQAERAAEQVVGAGRAVSAQVEALRRHMLALRPHVLDERGLGDALLTLAADFEARFDRRCHVHAAGLPDLDPMLATTLFRIAQEAIGNAGKHAGPSDVDVTLAAEDGHACLTVGDRGPGVDLGKAAARGHLGLPSMRERAQAAGGTLDVAPRPGGGTLVTARVPLG